MNKIKTIFLFFIVFLFISCAGNKSVSQLQTVAREHSWSQAELNVIKNLSLYSLIPKVDASNRVVGIPQAAELGRKLFFDKRFSKNGQIACANCHIPEKYFTDGLDTAQGLAKTSRNAPSVVGASQNTWFFHDGRSDSLWSQALGPLENELEHGGTRSQYANIVYSDSGLRKQYEKIFGEMPNLTDKVRFPLNAGPVNDKLASHAWSKMQAEDRQAVTQIFVNIGKAIAAYETTLQPTPSRFDDYVQAVLQNKTSQMLALMSKDEVTGLRLFVDKARCFICHSGPMFTDMEFHNVNTPAPDGKKLDWGRYSGARQVLKSEFNCRSSYNDAENKSCDELNYIITEQDETMGSMKTPSLRNVSKTAPYMHAGQYKALSEVIEHYNDPPPLVYRLSDLLDIELNKKEMKQIELFLMTLDSDIANI